jgi:hypothetical protein
MNEIIKDQLSSTQLEAFKGQGLSKYSLYLDKTLTDLMIKNQPL